jgi:predicted glycoside hydrolase/deacetylase ChbG (UPF0249 family)
MAEDRVPVMLCADDFAFAPGVSAGILALVRARRLTAVSVMMASPFWETEAPKLAARDHAVDLGLHLVLTDQQPLTTMPRLAPAGRLPAIGALIRGAYLGSLPQIEIEAEIAAQLERFTMALGRAPDFVDGHQHAHLLPGVREAVLGITRSVAPRAWVRQCADRPGSMIRHRVALPKAILIGFLSRGMTAAVRDRGLRTNPGFRGVLDYGAGRELAAAMPRFLASARPGLLVMCHPGEVDPHLENRDPLVAARARELAYLAGPDFPRDLERAGCRLARFEEVCACTAQAPQVEAPTLRAG